jgi:hypothetical protein
VIHLDLSGAVLRFLIWPALLAGINFQTLEFHLNFGCPFVHACQI